MLFSGCVMDSINITQLINETGEDIEVCVYYDKPYLDSLKISSYKGFLQQQSQRGESFLVNVDTIAVTITYKVPKNRNIDLFDGWGIEPDFKPIHLVTVRSDKGIRKYNRSIISNSISERKGIWEWHIK